MNSGWQNDEEKYELKYKNIAKLFENNALVIVLQLYYFVLTEMKQQTMHDRQHFNQCLLESEYEYNTSSR